MDIKFYNSSGINPELSENPFADEPSFKEVSDIMHRTPMQAFSYFWEAFQVILILVICAADLFLIITILRFRHLHTKVNKYILHIIVFNLLHFAFIPVCELTLLGVLHRSVGEFVYCTFQILENNFLFLHFSFSFFMSLDWCLITFLPNIMKKINKVYQFKILILYFIDIFVIIWQFAECVGFDNEIPVFSLRIFYFLYVSILIFINYLRYSKNIPHEALKTQYAVTISNIILLPWLPQYIFNFLFFHFVVIQDFYIEHEHILSPLTSFLFDYTAWCGIIVVVYMLGKLNKHFKIAYDKSFKRNVEYDGDQDLDNISEDCNINP